jgi:hypothetical protein
MLGSGDDNHRSRPRPPPCTGIEHRVMSGTPPGSSTAYMERNNLTMRRGTRRFSSPTKSAQKRWRTLLKEGGEPSCGDLTPLHVSQLRLPHPDAPQTGQAPGSQNHPPCPWASRITSVRSWRSSPCRTRPRATPTDSLVTRPLIQVAVSVGSIDRVDNFNFPPPSNWCRGGVPPGDAGSWVRVCRTVVKPLTVTGPTLTVRARAAGTSGYLPSGGLPSGGLGRWGG